MENRSTPTESHAEAILNAAGSSLRNYTMPATREAILAAVQDACGHFDRIRQWASDRNLIEGSNPRQQMKKLREEVQELDDAIEYADWAAGVEESALHEFADAIGDCIVVLAIMAAQWGLRVEDCIAGAYEEIKDRRGKMVDGVFVKEPNP